VARGCTTPLLRSLWGPPVADLAEDEQGYVDAARQFIADYSVEFLAVEVICVVERLAIAGCIDWIGRMGPKVVLGDWKSRGGRHGAYAEETAQLGLYSLADYLVVGEFPGTKVPMPEIDELVIVSLRQDGTYEAYPVNVEGAREAARHMAEAFLHGQDLAQEGSVAIGDPVKGAAPLPPPDELLEARRAWLQGRVRALPAEAKSYAARTWPADTPKKASLMTHGHIDAVAVCLDLTEAEHEAQFFTPDPATPKPEPGSASPRRRTGGRNPATNNPKG
jgi:hypothetical protein